MERDWKERIAVRERAAFERFDRFYHRCQINVLVVADGFLYFNDSDFGLSDFISIMQSAPIRVQFNITRAHRDNPDASLLAGATPNFVFTDAALATFDQIWLFAANSSGALAPAELLAITNFMQAGKGVFATGDHESLGVAMCGEIPRVRSMRKWYWPGAGPLGEPIAPPGGTEQRHDTNRPGRNTTYTFDDQSDSIPQPITPKLYFRRISVVLSERYPHPLLCGPHGTIRVLPDHPHEGDCIVPPVLDRELDIGPAGGTIRITEFPNDASGHRVVPDVVATSTMLAGAQTETKPPIPGGTFGAIGAYDGHRANVGRIVVDATWHHFININLTGAEGGSDAEKRVGFLHAQSLPIGDPERARIERDYDQIRGYFHNIGMWLAPATRQGCLSLWALRYVAKSYPLVEELANIEHKRLQLEDYARIGATGFERLKAFVRPCGALKIAIEVFPPPRELWPIDPWGPWPPGPGPGPGPDPLPFVDMQGLELANLGAVLVELNRIDGPIEARVDEKTLQKALVKGQKQGAELVSHALAQLSRSLLRFDKTLAARAD